MHKTLFVSALTLALAGSGSAFAQSTLDTRRGQTLSAGCCQSLFPGCRQIAKGG